MSPVKPTTRFQRLSEIARADDASILRELTALVGIGRWTVDWFLARFLGRGEAIAAGDLAVRRAIQYFYFNGAKVDEKRIRQFAARWGEFTNLAIHYLLTAYGSR
jgi:DNA-3-methyladenine glycosylase II|tara:strand:+ start:480 stop:794 length:315 start_codon:yes stop_codon:yes gene_type:complete